MKKPLLIILITSISLLAKAQKKETDSVYSFVDTMPVFGAGDFSSFLGKNIRYPVNAMMSGIRGKAYVQFIIQKDGTINNAVIIRSVSPEIDAEALRVVNSSPKWQPGIHNGKAVAVRITIPITFNLAASKNNPAGLNDTTVYAFDDIVSPKKDDAFLHVVKKVPIIYPEKAKVNGIQGVVMISFIVEKDSSVSNIKMIKKVSPELDNEAIRVIQYSKWIPYILGGKPIRVLYKVRIPFNLDNR